MRRTIRAVLVVALSVVLTCAASIVCALVVGFDPLPSFVEQEYVHQESDAYCAWSRGHGFIHVLISEPTLPASRIVRGSVPWFVDLSRDVDYNASIRRYQFGWPWPAMSYETRATPDGLVVLGSLHMETWSVAPLHRDLHDRSWRYVPLQVERAPFAASIALWAVIIAAVVWVYCQGQRCIARRRRLQAKCANCSYSLGTLEICPECGRHSGSVGS